MKKKTPAKPVFPFRGNFNNAAALTSKYLLRRHRLATSELGIMNDEQRIIVGGHDILADLLQTIDLGQALYLFIKREVPEKKLRNCSKASSLP